jgi:hypothetical protein
MQKLYKLLKILWKRIDIYWEDLHIKSNNEEINKAKKQIIKNVYVICFILGIMLISYISVQTQNIADKEGSGFIFFGMVIIFIFWVFVTSYTRKKNKHHSHPYLKEKNLLKNA